MATTTDVNNVNNAPPTNEAELEEQLSRPDDSTRDALGALDGDLLILGAGGKMGPTLARMARRALDDMGAPRAGPNARRVIAVSRFSNADHATALQQHGVEVLRADLTNPDNVRALPRAASVVWMVGQKFGTTGDPVGTWAHNVAAAVYGADHCAGARAVCFSSGNVYARSAVTGVGSRETDALAPDGDYAASCVGRERVFEAAARRLQFPLVLYRLFYACDLRYGVVTDIAMRVARGEPVSLATPAVNVIWQGDANRLALRALGAAAVPALALALNVTGAIVRVRTLAERIAARLGVTARFSDAESAEALLANTEKLNALLPWQAMPAEQLCDWAARWVESGARLLGKPTKYDVRDGKF